jgi:hypothetical protein
VLSVPFAVPLPVLSPLAVITVHRPLSTVCALSLPFPVLSLLPSPLTVHAHMRCLSAVYPGASANDATTPVGAVAVPALPTPVDTTMEKVV